MVDKTQPFLKWVGGKRQLLPEIMRNLPSDMDTVHTYVEPFVGGGAVLFHLAGMYSFDNIIINDANVHLINLYRAVQTDVDALCTKLDVLHRAYAAADEGKRKEMFYKKRSEYNAHLSRVNGEEVRVDEAALFVFLNRTCFNGLHRVNRKGEFNTPFGYYKNPAISNPQVFRRASATLGRATILSGDYADTLPYASEGAFFYLDPPYRPLTRTSAFTAYAASGFNDDAQRELAAWCGKVDAAGGKFLLSNSDPTNTDPQDMFFDDLYKNYVVGRVLARRNVNAQGEGRGKINELLVCNYIVDA